MSGRLVISNNPLVAEKCGITIEYSESWSYLDVLLNVRDKVHAGFRLISHPLSGSIKPNETLYKTVILEQAMGLEFDSLDIIENAIEVTLKFNKDRRELRYTEQIKADFQLIDYSLIKESI